MTDVGEVLPAVRARLDTGPCSGRRAELSVDPADPRIVSLAFDSDVLGSRTVNRIWVPPLAARTDESLPVVYFLHGTAQVHSHPVLEERLRQRRADGKRVPWGLQPADDSVVPSSIMRFPETLDRHRFLLVALDAGAPPWCKGCNWIDGVRGRGVLAETHLYDEVLPIIEHAFATRSDRGGRAIIGHSMGGGGALIQAFRHPDRFVFAGSSSGTLTLMDDRVSKLGVRWLLYARSQGLRPIPLDEIHYRNHNLLDLAAQTVGSGTRFVSVCGDGTDNGETRPYGRISPRAERRMELVQRRNNDLVAPQLIHAGVPLRYVQRVGTHAIGASTFRQYFLDELNDLLWGPPPATPDVFAYKSADPRFSIWGYDVVVERPNVEFTHLTDARTDGRSFTVGGSGAVEVTTPATFEPDVELEARATIVGGVTDRWRVRADASGRVHVTVDTGLRRREPERRRAVRTGRWELSQVEVEIRDTRST